MAAATILDFRNSQILLNKVRRAGLHHFAKFYHNPSIHCGDVAISRQCKIAAVLHLVFIWNIFGPLAKVG